MMNVNEMDYTSLMTKAMVLLDDDDKVRRFLMETTRILQALSKSDVVFDYEQRVFRRNYWRFVLRYNLTPAMNRATASKLYARFVGGYCEGLDATTENVMGMLVEELADSISRGESKDKQQTILDSAITQLLRN